MNESPQERLRRIPSMETILTAPAVQPLLDIYGRESVKEQFRRLLDDLRRHSREFDLDDAAGQVSSILAERQRPSLRTVVNATGVLIHTNLGRSPLGHEHLQHASTLLTAYSNLEFDLGDGSRGSRHHHVTEVATSLFGCESALLVNNNAAAVLLALSALAAGREVIVSRGELVEIGGSFRIPDIIQQGGAILREVGTTNRTRATDYEAAINDDTAAILVVHQSNFKIVGFTESPDLSELIGIAHSNGIPLILDEGSGRAVDLSPYGLPRYPTLRELLEMGVDLIASSTDKLIGASQGGLLLGRESLIRSCSRHPLLRALRPGKESFAIIASALSAFARGRHEAEIPLYRMLSVSTETLWKRATKIAKSVDCEIVETESVVGGGTTPSETIRSIALAFADDPEGRAERLRRHDPPIVGRVQEGRFHLDLRTVLPEQDEILAAALMSL